VNDLVLATVKAGYAFDDLLVYGKAGYAGGSVNGGSAYSPAAPAKGVTWTDTEWQNGWTVGAGAAYALTKNLRVNADYNFVDLGTAPFGAKDSVGTPTSIGTHTTDNVFTVGLNYAF
jgi:outer membrane immunogenic protein